jgi:hypothetical protein
VAALEREMQNLTAAGQLAGFVTDRAGGGDYRTRLGIMTQIRQDFHRMADLLASAASDPTPSPPPARIAGSTNLADPDSQVHFACPSVL